MKRFKKFALIFSLFLTACSSSNDTIVNSVEEREANEIVVYLASKGITAQKIPVPQEMGGAPTAPQFNISVSSGHATQSMALLSRVGLPRAQGTNLLTLFAKSGLMSSDREETIRYQAGLAEEIKNTLLKIDGILDANVQISFPPSELTSTPGTVIPKTTAAVYVKHQGIVDDPNSHLETKIKRLVSSSVNGLAFEDVSVISDRARFAEVQTSSQDPQSLKHLQDSYVSIWSIVMTKSSLSKFRFVFFSLILLNLMFAGALGYMIYRFYPLLLNKVPETKTPEEPPIS
jgi:type III secretion protein J